MEIILVAVSGVATALALWDWWRLHGLNQRVTAAFGDTGLAIEDTLGEHLSRVKRVETKLDKLAAAYQDLTATSQLASQKIAVVRFNPFGDTGGDQSFALAVLDAHNSGYILTSIHGREGTRVYVKPVDYTKSKYPLSVEEKQALALAIKRIPTKQETDNGSKE